MSLLKVEIRDAAPAGINEKSGVARGSGRPYHMIEQDAFCTFPNGEVRRVTLSLEKIEEALPPGQYEPKPSAFYAGDWGSIAVSMRTKHWQRVEPAKLAKVG